MIETLIGRLNELVQHSKATRLIRVGSVNPHVISIWNHVWLNCCSTRCELSERSSGSSGRMPRGVGCEVLR